MWNLIFDPAVTSPAEKSDAAMVVEREAMDLFLALREEVERDPGTNHRHHRHTLITPTS